MAPNDKEREYENCVREFDRACEAVAAHMEQVSDPRFRAASLRWARAHAASARMCLEHAEQIARELENVSGTKTLTFTNLSG